MIEYRIVVRRARHFHLPALGLIGTVLAGYLQHFWHGLG